MREVDLIGCMVRARLKTTGLENFGFFVQGDFIGQVREEVEAVLRNEGDPEFLDAIARVLVRGARQRLGATERKPIDVLSVVW